MIALLQRVAEARVEIDGRIVGRIGTGLLLFVCAEPDDTEAIADKLVDKVLRLRVFADAAGKMNLDLATIGGGLLVVSQFTLAADTSAATGPVFPAPPGPISGGGSTNGYWRPPRRVMATSATASSAPTCRSTSSTTGRSRFR